MDKDIERLSLIEDITPYIYDVSDLDSFNADIQGILKNFKRGSEDKEETIKVTISADEKKTDVWEADELLVVKPEIIEVVEDIKAIDDNEVIEVVEDIETIEYSETIKVFENNEAIGFADV